MVDKKFHIIANTGFARAATLFVSVTHRYSSRIVLEYQGRIVDLKQSSKSIMDIMSLEIAPGVPIHIRAEGLDERQALNSIADQIRKNETIESMR